LPSAAAVVSEPRVAGFEFEFAGEVYVIERARRKGKTRPTERILRGLPCLVWAVRFVRFVGLSPTAVPRRV